eukprot:181318-Chlamydomonas_euryale.AAC.2
MCAKGSREGRGGGGEVRLAFVALSLHAASWLAATWQVCARHDIWALLCRAAYSAGMHCCTSMSAGAADCCDVHHQRSAAGGIGRDAAAEGYDRVSAEQTDDGWRHAQARRRVGVWESTCTVCLQQAAGTIGQAGALGVRLSVGGALGVRLSVGGVLGVRLSVGGRWVAWLSWLSWHACQYTGFDSLAAMRVACTRACARERRIKEQKLVQVISEVLAVVLAYVCAASLGDLLQPCGPLAGKPFPISGGRPSPVELLALLTALPPPLDPAARLFARRTTGCPPHGRFLPHDRPPPPSPWCTPAATGPQIASLQGQKEQCEQDAREDTSERTHAATQKLRELDEAANAKRDAVGAAARAEAEAKSEAAARRAEADEANRVLRDAESALASVATEMQRLRGEADELRGGRGRGDGGADLQRALPFGGRPVVELLRRVAAAVSDGRFDRPPVGPMGMHVALSDARWAHAVESAVGRSLEHFLVHTKRDVDTLRMLARGTPGVDMQKFTVVRMDLDLPL